MDADAAPPVHRHCSIRIRSWLHSPPIIRVPAIRIIQSPHRTLGCQGRPTTRDHPPARHLLLWWMNGELLPPWPFLPTCPRPQTCQFKERLGLRLTSELLHCLSAIPDPWPMAKITIDMEKPAQWVSKLSRLYFADNYARRTEGFPAKIPAPGVAPALDDTEKILPAGSENDRILSRMAGHLAHPSHAGIKSKGTPSCVYVPQRILVSRAISGPKGHSILGPIWVVHSNHWWTGQVHYPGVYPPESPSHMERSVHHSVCTRLDDPSHVPHPPQRTHQERNSLQCNRSQVRQAYMVWGCDSATSTDNLRSTRWPPAHA